MSIKVNLRGKKISEGRESLYLDFYPAIPHPKTGKPTRREFLGLYTYIDKADIKKQITNDKKQGKNTIRLEELYNSLKPLTFIDKQHNTETIRLAESIKEKRSNILNKPEIYSEYEKEKLLLKELGELCFVEYFRKQAHKKKESNHKAWLSALNYLESFTGGTLKFAEITAPKLESFKEYLLNAKSVRSSKTKLSNNSAVSYFNKVKAALKQAFQDGITRENISAKVKPIEPTETRKEFLTLAELNKLVKTPCTDQLLKRVALFSALTGLRFSDIQKLTWKELQFLDGNGYRINFNQKKTKGVEYYDINEQAYKLTEGTENPNDMPQDKHVFEGLKYSAYHNKALYQWIGSAGITKDITFHCFRHTFATLQLLSGTDIYTVSKMLGHKDLKTTQVYAKVVDAAKQKAANNIKLDL